MIGPLGVPELSSDWYQLVATGDVSLRQCDLLSNVPIPVPSEYPLEAKTEVPAKVGPTDAMILTQSCDILKQAVTSIVVARVETWMSFVDANKWGDDRLTWQREVQRGAVFHLCLLPERVENPSIPWSVVNFREVYTLPKELVQQHIVRQGVRLRLTPPHRESIAQAFGRYFMRVALEDDLQRFRSWSPGGVKATEASGS